jgi:hypothetical protein
VRNLDELDSVHTPIGRHYDLPGPGGCPCNELRHGAGLTYGPGGTHVMTVPGRERIHKPSILFPSLYEGGWVLTGTDPMASTGWAPKGPEPASLCTKSGRMATASAEPQHQNQNRHFRTQPYTHGVCVVAHRPIIDCPSRSAVNVCSHENEQGKLLGDIWWQHLTIA